MSTTNKVKAPTEAGLRVLRLLSQGLSPDTGIHGMAAYGGLGRTMEALVRRGLIRKGQITPEGQEVVRLAHKVAAQEAWDSRG